MDTKLKPNNRRGLSGELLLRTRESDKSYQRNRRKLYPKAEYERKLAYEIKYPERIKANRKLRYEVNKGRIQKLPCRDCERTDVQAHHPDYSKPLDIIWLCPSHHKKEDMKNK